MTKLSSLIEFLESIAPLTYQEPYDNAGLLTGDRSMDIKGVLVCLDSLEAVIDEAVSMSCNVVVAHHPIIFSGLKNMVPDHYVKRCIIKAIKHDIAIYAIHTNLDNVYRNGVNEKIGKKIGLSNTRILFPNLGLDPEGNVGSGLIGELDQEMDANSFFMDLKEKMDLKVIKHTAVIGRPIKHVAVCGGAGSFLIDQAIFQKADVFITSDVKYHEFFDADDRVILVDIGHYESERYTINQLVSLITGKFSNFASHCTKINTNPINYL